MNQAALTQFLRDASLATYAGDGHRVKSDRPGFYDLEYRDGDFYYRDSFAGFLSSHGQETVWYQDKPVWMCSYFGGMQGAYADDPVFAERTFEFLKACLRAGKRTSAFSHRGPESYTATDWTYHNHPTGDEARFMGHEEIAYRGELVFIHDYFGGLLRDGRSL